MNATRNKIRLNSTATRCGSWMSLSSKRDLAHGFGIFCSGGLRTRRQMVMSVSDADCKEPGIELTWMVSPD